MKRFERNTTANGGNGLHGCCNHSGFHSPLGRYDRHSGELRYITVCDSCGAETAEVRREPYIPKFNPTGNDQYTAAAT